MLRGNRCQSDAFLRRCPNPNPNPDPDQVLTTPVQFYFGAPFHRSARAALRHCTFNMDVLVSLGTFAAYASPSPAPWT